MVRQASNCSTVRRLSYYDSPMQTETLGTAVLGEARGGDGQADTPPELALSAVLAALSDPIRLRIVAQLADGAEHNCGSFNLPITKSTCSHHFRVLREAGVTDQRVDGKCRLNRLRRDELEQAFPGLLEAVLHAQSV